MCNFQAKVTAYNISNVLHISHFHILNLCRDALNKALQIPKVPYCPNINTTK